MYDSAYLLKAVAFAAEKHRGQRRKGADGTPYINHPIRVAEILADVGGVHDLRVLSAAVLHDTLEDTHTSPEELREAFGPEVLALVQEVTDNKALHKTERKQLQIEHAPRLTREAKLIKLADKIANVRDVTDDPPKDWPMWRRLEYVEWAEKVVAGCRGVSDALEREFDHTLRRAREKMGSE